MLVSLLASSASRSSTSFNIDEIRVDWHLAGLSEAQENWAEARDNFQKVVRESQFLPLPIREWFRAMAWLGISRASARLHDTLSTRTALAAAFERGFSNPILLSKDSL